VEEYYIYDPDRHEFEVLMRGADGLDVVEVTTDWTSPRLQVRFDWSGEELQVFDPSGQPFLRHTAIAVQFKAPIIGGLGASLDLARSTSSKARSKLSPKPPASSKPAPNFSPSSPKHWDNHCETICVKPYWDLVNL
jgi:hypothetical protein